MGGPSPLSMNMEKVYPSDQPMVFNPQELITFFNKIHYIVLSIYRF